MNVKNYVSLLLLVVGLFLLHSLPALADGRTRGEMPVQIQLLSSSIGAGGSLGYNFNSTVYVGVEGIVQKEELQESDVVITGDLTTSQLIARFSVWDDSGFYLQLGAAARDWVVQGVGYTCVGPWGDSTCSDRIQIKVEWPAVAGIYGIGWNWISDFGLSGGLGLSIYAGDDPEVTYTDLNNTATESQLLYEKEQNEDLFMGSVGNFYFNIGWNF